MMRKVATIGWPDGRGLCAESPNHRGFTRVSPRTIQSLTFILRENRKDSAQSSLTLITGRRSGRPLCASYPKLFSGLSPGLRHPALIPLCTCWVRTGWVAWCTQGGILETYTRRCIPPYHTQGCIPPTIPRVYIGMPRSYLRVYIGMPRSYLRVYSSHRCVPKGGILLTAVSLRWVSSLAYTSGCGYPPWFIPQGVVIPVRFMSVSGYSREVYVRHWGYTLGMEPPPSTPVSLLGLYSAGVISPVSASFCSFLPSCSNWRSCTYRLVRMGTARRE